MNLCHAIFKLRIRKVSFSSEVIETVIKIGNEVLVVKQLNYLTPS